MNYKSASVSDDSANRPRITIVLLNYKRPRNIPVILNAIRQQTVKARVYLWNNGGDNVNTPLIDRYIESPRNVGCMARWKLAREATTEYVMSLDDDICFNRHDALEDIIESLDKQDDPNRIIDIIGARFSADPDYRTRREYICRYLDVDRRPYAARTIEFTDEAGNPVVLDIRVVGADESVDIVKGRMMAFRRELLDRIELPDEREDDIFLSAAFSSGARGFHRIPAALHDSCRELPEFDVANWHQPGHMQSRDRALKAHFPADLASVTHP